MVPSTRTSAYDNFADEYAAAVASREQDGPESDPYGILPHLLAVLGDVASQSVLDAGCGQGYLARILATRGARVTGIDLSPRLVEMAGAADSDGQITYLIADLCTPLPEHAESFDAIASYLVLNDVEDHRGFAQTLASVLKPGGRAVLALNNPYSYVIRKHLGAAYFASGSVHPCGLARAGIGVSFYHRTLGEYVDAFIDAGLQVTKILDVDHPTSARYRVSGQTVPPEEEIPRFMVLGLIKPERSSDS
jgi:SAM-dependent methyltransferase